MSVHLYINFHEHFLSLEAVCLSMSVCLYMYVYVSWGLLEVWGELASHKRSLTHCPSSQGWASRCPLLYVCLGNGWVGYLSYFHMLVCLTHVFPCILYLQVETGDGRIHILRRLERKVITT